MISRLFHRNASGIRAAAMAMMICCMNLMPTAQTAIAQVNGIISMQICVDDRSAGFPLEAASVRVRRRPKSDTQQEATGVTDSSGCVSLDVAVSVGTEDGSDIPAGLTSGPPFPNPASNHAVIPFKTGDARDMRFQVFDILGRSVLPTWRASLAAGSYSMDVDLSGLASGVYFYRFEQSGGTTTGKLVKIGDASGGHPSTRLLSGSVASSSSSLQRSVAKAGSSSTIPIRVWISHEGYDSIVKDFDVSGGESFVLDMPKAGTTTTMVPLTDMGTGTYYDFDGGLYAQGSVAIPQQHFDAGTERAESIEPLDVDGNPDPNGKYILMSIGFSNATQEWCSASSQLVTCNDWTFIGQANADTEVNHDQLVLVDGAKGGEVISNWLSPNADNYTRIVNDHLTPLGLSEKQVSAIWVKVNNSTPTISLPDPDAEAFQLKGQYGELVRTLQVRYPNLKLVFFSSRIYGGYATVNLHPEPYAYETGFGVKWTIQAQIDQMAGLGTDPETGDLDYNTVAPWIAWGPYLWANGLTPRLDDLTWEPSDFEDDGTHPAQSAETKVGTMLLNFFKSSEQTRCWFLLVGVCGANNVSKTPLIDMQPGDQYQGFEGGLYPGVTNVPPVDNAAEGLSRAQGIEPLDVNGNPDPNGKYVFMSIGMSNTTQEFCNSSTALGCNPWSFMGQAAADPDVNHETLTIVNGAQGGKGADSWVSATGDQYDRILDEELTPKGLSEKQVQIIYFKDADKNSGANPALPDPNADAYLYEQNLGLIARALKTRYPNLKIMFVSSRVYGGYAPLTTNNPEPYAFETGFSVKWMIQAQIDQMAGGGIDPVTGDLDFNSVAPWLVWGPYFWADGLNPRSDGLTWARDEFEPDGSHPNTDGETKVAGIMMDFFKTSPYSACWFVTGGTCGN